MPPRKKRGQPVDKKGIKLPESSIDAENRGRARDLVDAVLPHDYLDWTGKAITAMGDEQKQIIKNQRQEVRVLTGMLGSTIRDQLDEHICWAVSVAAATEAVNNLKRRPDDFVWEASPQELIDHVPLEKKAKRNLHLGLTRMSTAWDYVKNNYLSQEKHYPYQAGQRNCEADLHGKESREVNELLLITGSHEVETVNEIALLKQLYEQPVIGIFAWSAALDYWDGLGIFRGDGSVERKKDFEILEALNPNVAAEVRDKSKGKAKNVAIEEKNEEVRDEIIASEKDFLKLIDPRKRNVNLEDHAVLIVGYGTSSTGKHYFLIRNSYGEHWGIRGIGKIMRASSLGHDSSGRQKGSLVKGYSYPVLQVQG